MPIDQRSEDKGAADPAGAADAASAPGALDDRSAVAPGAEPVAPGAAGGNAGRGVDEHSAVAPGTEPGGSGERPEDKALPGVPDLAALEAKLSKRGFRRDDLFLHQCPVCREQAVLKYILAGKTGGRDIALCQACGLARSWRSAAGFQSREEDVGFDLRAFLR